ncbi:uncharacterized protein EI97DRAFT_192096 [Westerdykella ornata]|uniref:Uncharacterized protein n=1 Tax=Westerdykella ornata TaxID=318751 RepID=A0A6A6J8V8_WESOR|nr:uncharacterized protein EI97DRAFT_192096 [Westerdykella ornata]KAF2273001.1 hypothetical protein EI97DRAFT_192096 [Westerdykella ornata]
MRQHTSLRFGLSLPFLPRLRQPCFPFSCMRSAFCILPVSTWHQRSCVHSQEHLLLHLRAPSFMILKRNPGSGCLMYLLEIFFRRTRPTVLTGCWCRGLLSSFCVAHASKRSPRSSLCSENSFRVQDRGTHYPPMFA